MHREIGLKKILDKRDDKDKRINLLENMEGLFLHWDVQKVENQN